MLMNTAVTRSIAVIAKEGDTDEANEILRTAVKHCKSLSSEVQDDVILKLRIGKRKLEAAFNVCSRCDRAGHDARDCYAHNAKGGRAFGDAAIGRGPSRPRYNSQPQGAAAFYGPASQAQAAYSPAAPGYSLSQPPPAMHAQMQYGGAQQQQQAGYGGQRPYEPQRPYVAQRPRSCHICQSEAHLMFQCPQNQNRGAPVPPVPNAPPARQVSETAPEKEVEVEKADEWEDMTEARPEVAGADGLVDVYVAGQASRWDDPALSRPAKPKVEHHTPSQRHHKPTSSRSSDKKKTSGGTAYTQAAATAAAIRPRAEAASSATPDTIDLNADSQADWLEEGGWAAAMAVEDEKTGCLFMYKAVLENKQKHTNQAAVEAPQLTTSAMSEEAMQK